MYNKDESMTGSFILLMLFIIFIAVLLSLFLGSCGSCNKDFCWSSREEMNKLLAEEAAMKAELDDLRVRLAITDKEFMDCDNANGSLMEALKQAERQRDSLSENLDICLDRAREEIRKRNSEAVKSRLIKHIVQPCDWLSRIALQPYIYKDMNAWPKIYDRNKNIIKNPDLIYPGQELWIER